MLTRIIVFFLVNLSLLSGMVNWTVFNLNVLQLTALVTVVDLWGDGLAVPHPETFPSIFRKNVICDIRTF